jgi:hypothetical protein
MRPQKQNGWDALSFLTDRILRQNLQREHIELLFTIAQFLK